MKTKAFVCSALLLLSTLLACAQTYTAGQLYTEKRGNSQLFDNQYFGKTFTVTGKIWTITPCTVELPGFKNVHQVALTGTGYEQFIICQLPFSDKAVLDQFKTGQVITVTGTYNEKLLEYVLLNNCTFKATAEETVAKKKAPLQLPLGHYSVYQQGAAGFSYQYTFHLKSYTSYTMNGKTGSARYDKKTNTIRFTTGLLKNFTGLYRPVNPNNAQDPPTIVLDPKGRVPGLDRQAAGYQYAYLKD